MGVNVAGGAGGGVGGGGGGGASGGGGRPARLLRLLLLFVLALAAVEYIFGSILDASPLRTYLYLPGYNATPGTTRSDKFTRWPKRILPEPEPNRTIQIPPVGNFTQNMTSVVGTVAVNISATNNALSNASLYSPAVANASTLPLLISKIVDGFKSIVTTESSSLSTILNQNVTKKPKKMCPATPPDLGPTQVNKTDLELEWVEKKFPEVQLGGRYAPPHCLPRHKVAIIVPYRDRQQHLAIFLNHMHPFLMKQQLDYGIFIVEQSGANDFNRAKLMNVGFVESLKQRAGGWQCFVFHDIDLLPQDGRNVYSCPRQPRHMSAAIDKLNYKLPYQDIFGGVSAMTKEQFTKVNGFSNRYWGWGGEDDDMFSRLQKRNYHIARYKMSIARYAMLDHKKSQPNPKRYQLLSQTSKTFLKDGLSTLEYELVEVTRHHLYTHILVNIDERS